MQEILRPMSTGELMDRTLGLYKRNFKLFVGIASLGPATHLLFQLLTVSSASLQSGTPTRVNLFSETGVGFGVVAGFSIMLAGMAIAHAATVRAVAAVHLGRTITVVEAYKSLKGRVWRVLGVFVCVFLLAALAAFVAVLLIAVAVVALRTLFEGVGRQAATLAAFAALGAALLVGTAAMIVWVRYALAIACCVVEDLGVIKSIKRSSALSKGSRFRIFLIYIVFLILAVLVGAALGALVGGVGSFISNVPARLVLIYFAGFLGGLVTGPLATIGLALVYYDERVRKEAFDLQVMMSDLDSPAPAADAPPVPIQT